MSGDPLPPCWKRLRGSEAARAVAVLNRATFPAVEIVPTLGRVHAAQHTTAIKQRHGTKRTAQLGGGSRLVVNVVVLGVTLAIPVYALE